MVTTDRRVIRDVLNGHSNVVAHSTHDTTDAAIGAGDSARHSIRTVECDCRVRLTDKTAHPVSVACAGDVRGNGAFLGNILESHSDGIYTDDTAD